MLPSAFVLFFFFSFFLAVRSTKQEPPESNAVSPNASGPAPPLPSASGASKACTKRQQSHGPKSLRLHPVRWEACPRTTAHRAA
jgi:hypothetical protein